VKPARGFTLLEVLLAFVLLGAAMGLLIAMLSNGLRQVRQAQDETKATLYAQSLLDQIGVLEPIAPVSRQGEFDRGRYRYQLEVTETRDPVPAPQPPDGSPAPVATVGGPKLYRVALAVSWGTGQPSQRLDFVTLRARMPQPAGAAPQ
jgi:general secretion pathway protein I